MERLIVVRHGSYGGDYHLSETGKNQMIELGEALKEDVNRKRVVILTSTANRARESASVLAEALGAKIEEHEVLWSESRHPEDLPAALALIRSKKKRVGILIMVTHLEYTEYFPRYFGKEELGVQFPCREIPKGAAWDIDCKGKTIRIRP